MGFKQLSINIGWVMKIIDACTFFNEIDTLKIRLNLLYEKVDKFVICESNITHSGIKKTWNFLECKNELAQWMDKIVYLRYEPDITDLDFTKKYEVFNPLAPSWKIETGQRNFLLSYIETLPPQDMVVVCDVDEIWNPKLYDYIKSGNNRYDAARLEMQFHYYWLNCIGVGQNNCDWIQPFYASAAYIKSYPNLSEIRTKVQLPIIGNAGWHFSYLGGAKKVSEKINAFAHQETNTEEINNLKHLERCIELGIDHLNRVGHNWAFYPIDRYPEDLKAVMLKYPDLIKSKLT